MQNLTEAISYLSCLIDKVLEKAVNQVDVTNLTPQQLHHLQVIVKMKNPSLTELAGELGLTKPTVTVLVDKLVEKGYVKRVKSDRDRRCMHLHIDKKGKKLQDLRKTACQQIAEKISSSLSEAETKALTELLKKIVE